MKKRWIISYEFVVHIRDDATHDYRSSVRNEMRVIDVPPARFILSECRNYQAFADFNSTDRPKRATEITCVFSALDASDLTEDEAEFFN